MMPRSIFAPGLWLAFFLAGCSSAPSDLPETAPVSGTVLLNGQPLPNAAIRFQPESGRVSIGETDASGHYSLQYNDTTPGAKIGSHKVSITTYRDNSVPGDINSPSAPELLPPRYHEQTELTAEVQPGENKIDFNLEPKGK